MRINSDEAMMANPRLDTIGRVMITVGQLLTQIGTKVVQSRNELLAGAVEDARAQVEEAYHLGRQHERDGIHVVSGDDDEGQGDEDDEGRGPLAPVDLGGERDYA